MTAARTAALVALFALLAACASAPPSPPPPSEPPAPRPTPPAADVVVEAGPETGQAVSPGRARVRLAAVGDMMIGTNFPDNHLPDDDGVAFFQNVQPFLSSVDLAMGNLEGVLVDGGEPAKACSNPRACYLFRSPTRYAWHYRAAGFDLLSLANNHARDFGEAGRDSTMAALDRVGIRHSGRDGEFASLRIKGLRVAFLAFAVTRNSNLLLDYDLAEQRVREFSATHDIVVVSFHGGAEGEGAMNLPFDEESYYGEPRGDVVRFARRMVDAGADLVFGHGPHVVRAMERYRDRLIAYSLGNFATYYGISVQGLKGVAPILLATLDADGRFVEGEIVSTQQIRPAGPSIDPERKALREIRRLSNEDFDAAGLEFTDDGRILPVASDNERHP